ncbi:eukaryotic translation initiation factor 3 subunit D [Phlyctochytrium arcticum]|nr:eukaryotic translation initiation factor 3 subunit D [Phlyctochytrium arcticum]
MTVDHSSEGAPFVLPAVADNPSGWGPSSVPQDLAQVPYAPYSKSDRLGKIADWTAPAEGTYGFDRRHENDRRRRFGPQQEAFGSGLSSMFAYTVAAEDEATFSVVDRQTSTQKKPGFKAQRGRGGGRGGQSTWQPRGGAMGAGGRRDDRRGQQGPRRRYGGYNDKPTRIRDPSVQVGPEWKVLDEWDFPRMSKLYYEVEEPVDLSGHGTCNYFDKSFDRVVTKQEKHMHQYDRNFLNVTASDDPILVKHSKQSSDRVHVYATDNVLATLMCSTRSVYSWDIVVTKQDNKIFLDKRDGGVFDFIGVNENAADPPMESADKDNINTPQALALEATYINRNFSQQVLKESEKYVLPNPNPFDDNSTPEPVPALAFRYRDWDLGDNIHLVARTQVDAVLHQPGANANHAEGAFKPRSSAHNPSDSLLVNVKALNEFDSRAPGAGGAPEWRQKLDSQRGAVMATEIKNNGNKLARWAVESILAGVDQIRLGFVSRNHPRDRSRHIILGCSTLKPMDLTAQMNFKVGNGWGILKTFINQVATYDDGKFVLVKDPNKSVLRIYSVPDDTFEAEEDVPEAADEADDDEE